jgi:hypothetical protein
MIGTLGIGLKDEEIGRFNRSLPPKTIVQYDPRWELGLEVIRWFHYRYNHKVYHQEIESVEALHVLMNAAYDSYIGPRFPKKVWPLCREIVTGPRIREFEELFKDVLAEIELTK